MDLSDTPLRGIRLSGGLWLLIGLCVLIEAVLLGADFGLWGSARWRPLAYQNGAFWAGLLHGWQPNYAAQPGTMFLSSAFLHTGPGHLIGNMLALALMGQSAEARLGGRRFAGLLAASALGGCLAFGLLTRRPAPMVGSSGAIFGLAGAWIVWEGQRRRAAGGPIGRTVLAPVLGLALGLAALNLLMWVTMQGQVAWETHLGGALAGAAAALVLRPRAAGPA